MKVEEVQIEMDLSQTTISSGGESGGLYQAHCEQAYKLSQDLGWMSTLEKMLNGPGADGVTTETRELYASAVAIRLGRLKFGRNGWKEVI